MQSVLPTYFLQTSPFYLDFPRATDYYRIARRFEWLEATVIVASVVRPYSCEFEHWSMACSSENEVPSV
jgi:chemotaxis methyl-accepting protein methylase